MDNLETPYDEEAEFIECKVCEKSIRGDTLYKIHLTTPGHIKVHSISYCCRQCELYTSFVGYNVAETPQ